MKLNSSKLRFFTLAFTALSFMPISAQSIEKGTSEFGVDGSITITDFNSRPGRFGTAPRDLVQISFPSRVRIGTFTSENTELDFMVNFASDSQGEKSLTTVEINLGIGFHLSSGSEGTIRFIEPIWGVRFISANSQTAAQYLVGVEGGIKVLSTFGLATRVSGSINHGFETDNFLGSTTFGFNLGVSFLSNK